MVKRFLNYFRRIFYTPEKYARHIGVKIGENCLIHTKYFPSEGYLIEIGNNVRLAANVKFFTHGGVWSQRYRYPNLDFFGKIKIGDNTYIGDGVYIMPGVSIGEDVIIGAGSVVSRSIPDGVIVAGNPGKIVGKTIDFMDRIKTYNLGTKGMTTANKKEYLMKLSDDKFIKKDLIKV